MTTPLYNFSFFPSQYCGTFPLRISLAESAPTDLMWGIHTTKVFLSPAATVRSNTKVLLSSSIWQDDRYTIAIKSMGTSLHMHVNASGVPVVSLFPYFFYFAVILP
jgi:hypothetical protein